MELWKDVKAESESVNSENEDQLTLGFVENSDNPTSVNDLSTPVKDEHLEPVTNENQMENIEDNIDSRKPGPHIFRPAQSQIDAALKKQQSHSRAREAKKAGSDKEKMYENNNNNSADAPVKKQAKEGKSTKKEALKSGAASFGKYLQETRIEQGYSVAQVEDATKIRSYYIEALENEQVEKLPPGVFIFAYVRSICSFYKTPQGKVDYILAELKSRLDKGVPQELYENINLDYEVDQESEQRLRNLTWLISGGAVLLVAIITAAVIILIPGKPAKAAKTKPVIVITGEKVNEAQLETIITGKPQTLDISALPVNDQ
ncbi:helix-turn-helix domain-containing protein [Lentisphaerota bacterium ZTH]|nr:helix-turn-helix domain-containing protein [Lentisphaerota bacterium]WET05287.1 helix-turn-helix domain-containing protein [Lentisphaerota bacterium ZTH]